MLAGAFATSAAHVVTFDNSQGDRDASNTVYVGVKADLPIPKAIIEAAPASRLMAFGRGARPAPTCPCQPGMQC